jgi:phage shock protein C
MSTNLLEKGIHFFHRLYRDSEQGWLFGVCAGLADIFRVNVAGVRVLVAVTAWFFTLPTAIAYVVLGMLLRDRPLRYQGRADERHFWSRRSDGRVDGDHDRAQS